MATFRGESPDGMSGWEINLPQEPDDVYRVQQLVINARIALAMLKGEQLYDTSGLQSEGASDSVNEHFAQNIFCELSLIQSRLSDRRDVLHREVRFAPLAQRFEQVLMPLVEVARAGQWQQTATSNPACLQQLEQLIAEGCEYLKSRGFEEQDPEAYAASTDWLDRAPSR